MPVLRPELLRRLAPGFPFVFFISVAFFGISALIFMPALFTILMELPHMTPQMVVMVMAITLSAGNVGGFLGPLIVGYLADLTGSYWAGLALCSALSWSLLISGLLLPETGPKAKRMA